MRIVSLILRIKGSEQAAARAALLQIPGVEIQAEEASSGHVIVTVEDVDTPVQELSVHDAIIAVHQVPQVMSATLAYEFNEELEAALEVAPCQ
jgi:nitrate reductase NapD